MHHRAREVECLQLQFPKSFGPIIYLTEKLGCMHARTCATTIVLLLTWYAHRGLRVGVKPETVFNSCERYCGRVVSTPPFS
jgi:hypothetical protein